MEDISTMRSVSIACVVVATGGVAVAQPAVAQPALVPPAVAQPSERAVLPSPHAVADDPRYVDPQTAMLFSLGGTAASYGVLAIGATMQHGERVAAIGAIGTLIAPSFGRWYAGSAGLGGLGWRLAGAGMGVGGVALLLDNCLFKPACDEATPAALIIAGGVAYLGGTIYDIVHAGRDAEMHNERLKLVPTASASDRRVGLALSGRF